MEVKDCVFNPVHDKTAVEPFGFIDLKESLVSGIVPTVAPDSDVAYNGIDNPDSILGRPRDVFEAMDMERAINSYQPDKDGNKEG